MNQEYTNPNPLIFLLGVGVGGGGVRITEQMGASWPNG
jgi:hypothetical protein